MPARKPNEVKRRNGNPGHRPLPKGITVLEPVNPRALAVASDGDELVQKLLAGPASAWIAEPDQIGLLQLVRDAWDERARLHADIATHGYGDGRYMRPAVGRLERVERNLTSWLSLLGLSPVDRSRLGVAEVKARSKLEELRARRGGRSRAG